MIYELRTYTLVPGTLPEYLRLQREVGRPIRGDRFGKFEGAWSTEFGTLNQYVHLWSYADAGDRQRQRAELGKDERWKNEFLAATRSMVLVQENKLLFPVEGVPFTAPEGSGHIYELRTYRTHYQKSPEWLSHFRAVLPARQEYSKLVSVWSSDVGSLNQLVHLWVYDDLNQRAQVRTRVLEDSRWQDYLARSVPLLQEQQSVVLIPAAHSPLQ